MSEGDLDLPAGEWVTMQEAQKLTGMSRAALQQRKNRGMLEAKVVPAVLVQRGKRILFKRSQLPVKEQK